MIGRPPLSLKTDDENLTVWSSFSVNWKSQSISLLLSPGLLWEAAVLSGSLDCHLVRMKILLARS